MKQITEQQYTELMKKINNVVWRDNQRRKQINSLEINNAVLHNNVQRHEGMLTVKLKVNKYDEGFEEPYDINEQENSR